MLLKIIFFWLICFFSMSKSAEVNCLDVSKLTNAKEIFDKINIPSVLQDIIIDYLDSNWFKEEVIIFDKSIDEQDSKLKFKNFQIIDLIQLQDGRIAYLTKSGKIIIFNLNTKKIDLIFNIGEFHGYEAIEQTKENVLSVKSLNRLAEFHIKENKFNKRSYSEGDSRYHGKFVYNNFKNYSFDKMKGRQFVPTNKQLKIYGYNGGIGITIDLGYELFASTFLNDRRLVTCSASGIINVWNRDFSKSELLEHKNIKGIIQLKNNRILTWSDSELIIWNEDHHQTQKLLKEPSDKLTALEAIKNAEKELDDF